MCVCVCVCVDTIPNIDHNLLVVGQDAISQGTLEIETMLIETDIKVRCKLKADAKVQNAMGSY